MNYLQILDELRGERDMVDHAIAVLERLQVGAPRRRGRPPRWLAERKKEAGAGASAPVLIESGAVGPDGQPIKRRRGRPRKVQVALEKQ